MTRKITTLAMAAVLAITLPLLLAGNWGEATASASKAEWATPGDCSKSAGAATHTSCVSACDGSSAGCLGPTKACSGHKGGCCGKAEACCSGRICKKHIATLKSVSSDLPYRESKRLVMEGRYICGKCELKKFDSCQALFETTDGEVYPLVVNHSVRKMRCIEAKNGFRITSKVKRLHGLKYLEVTRFETL